MGDNSNAPRAAAYRSRSSWRNSSRVRADNLGMGLSSSRARRRELRASSLDAEALLWTHLRGRRLAGFKFRRQHPCRSFVLDFFCSEQRLAIELDGDAGAETGVRARGHAGRRDLPGADRRSELLADRGITVLRFPSRRVLRETEAVLATIAFALSARRPRS